MMKEAKLLKSKGGAGVPVNSSGVPSFFFNKLFGGGKDAPTFEKFDVGGSAREYVNAMSDPPCRIKCFKIVNATIRSTKTCN